MIDNYRTELNDFADKKLKKTQDEIMPQGSNSYILVNRDLGSIQVRVSYRDFKEDGWYFGECPELRLVDQGKTRKEAYENLIEMVLTTLITAVASDNIDSYLTKLGFKKARLEIPELKIFKLYIDLPDVIPVTLNSSFPSTTAGFQGTLELVRK
ncbi:MAG: hypothetical protein ABIC40_01970 [bacterium]